MKYKDLNLKQLREKCNLDFAHYTYGSRQCSCCYGPKDMPSIYWRDGKNLGTNDVDYILFKNSYNADGIVHKNDDIKDIQFVCWHCSKDKLHDICLELRKQFDDEWAIFEPQVDYHTIIICKKSYRDYPLYAADVDCNEIK